MTDKRIEKIFCHYGQEGQLNKMIEEAKELQDATRDLLYLIKAYQGDDRDERIERAKRHLAEEITDVRIMSDQLELGFDLFEECKQQREYKLNRQMKRIENELAICEKRRTPEK